MTMCVESGIKTAGSNAARWSNVRAYTLFDSAEESVVSFDAQPML